MKYIVGLGNPGQEYTETRHNVGFTILDAVHKAGDFSDWKYKKDMNADVAAGVLEGKKITLIKPNTYMNLSGSSLRSLVKSKKDAEKVLVIHDDLDLGLGTVKISFAKGSGGNRGVDSIIKQFKTNEFPRMRVGISKTLASGKIKKPVGEEDVVKFVLGKFSPAEKDLFKKVIKRGVEGVQVSVTDGYMLAMNVVN